MACPTTRPSFPALPEPKRNRAPSGKAEEVRWPATPEPASGSWTPGCLCCQSREAAPGGGRRIANYPRWRKTLCELGGGQGEGGRGQCPSTRPPASARHLPRLRSRQDACPTAPPPGQGARQQGRGTAAVPSPRPAVARARSSRTRSLGPPFPWGRPEESREP